MQKAPLGELQLEILRFLSVHGPLSVGEVTARFGERGRVGVRGARSAATARRSTVVALVAGAVSHHQAAAFAAARCVLLVHERAGE